MQRYKKLIDLPVRLLFKVMSIPIAGLYLHKSTRARVRLFYVDENEIEQELKVKGLFSSHQRWVFPGGGVDKDESTRQAASRELQEEVGIAVKPADLVFLERRTVTRFRIFYYTVELFEHKAEVHAEPKANWPEIIDAKYMPVEDA